MAGKVLSQITGGPGLDPLPGAATAAPNGDSANRLTASPFEIDHRAEIIKEIEAEAIEYDAQAAAHRIRGDTEDADISADLARSLRATARHLTLRA